MILVHRFLQSLPYLLRYCKDNVGMIKKTVQKLETVIDVDNCNEHAASNLNDVE